MSTAKVSSNKNRLLCSYHDACVYASDLSLLECGTAWLNDACVHFRMTQLEHRNDDNGNDNDSSTSTSSSSSKPRHSSLCYMDPSVLSYFVHQCHDREDLLDLHQSLLLSSAAANKATTTTTTTTTPTPLFLLVPINDSHHPSSTAWMSPGGGSHWSFLLGVVIRHHHRRSKDGGASSGTKSTFLHVDSSSPVSSRSGNHATARLVAHRLERWCRMTTTTSTTTEEDDQHDIHFQECANVPSQPNGYDCGLYALAAAEASMDYLLEHSYPPNSSNNNDKDEADEGTLWWTKCQEFIRNRLAVDGFALALRRRMATDIRAQATNG